MRRTGFALPGDFIRVRANMNAETLVKLIEEMMDLKVQQYAESHLKPNPEVAKLLMEKRETDRRRLEQIRAELARLIAARSAFVVA
jgi:hypothetical protein